MYASYHDFWKSGEWLKRRQSTFQVTITHVFLSTNSSQLHQSFPTIDANITQQGTLAFNFMDYKVNHSLRLALTTD